MKEITTYMVDKIKSEFKSVLDGFFVTDNCNIKLKDEDDFQEKLAKYLGKRGYKVIRELCISKDDMPSIQKQLEQDSILIDIVVRKDNYFFPLELKFENIKSQNQHVTKELYKQDQKKMKLVYHTFKDVLVSRTRILVNSKSTRDSIAADDEWHELLDGKRGDGEFMWQWHWWHDQDRNPSVSMSLIWDKVVKERTQNNKFKNGDNY